MHIYYDSDILLITKQKKNHIIVVINVITSLYLWNLKKNISIYLVYFSSTLICLKDTIFTIHKNIFKINKPTAEFLDTTVIEKCKHNLILTCLFLRNPKSTIDKQVH